MKHADKTSEGGAQNGDARLPFDISAWLDSEGGLNVILAQESETARILARNMRRERHSAAGCRHNLREENNQTEVRQELKN